MRKVIKNLIIVTHVQETIVDMKRKSKMMNHWRYDNPIAIAGQDHILAENNL